MLDPRQRCLAQFPGAGLHGLLVRDAIQPFSRESFGKIPRFEVQRLHSRPAALLAKKAGLMGIIKSRVLPEGRVASDATVEARQPATHPYAPDGALTPRHAPA